MGLSVNDWRSWRATAAQGAEDSGYWVALCNPEGEPVVELEAVDLKASETNLGLDSLDMTIPLPVTAGASSPIVDALVGPGLGVQNAASAAFEAQTLGGYGVVVQGPGGDLDRAYYVIDVPEVEGDAVGPLSLTLKATHMNTLLDWHPCPSVPGTWGDVGFTSWTEDAATAVSNQRYSKPRRIAPVQVSTIAYGHTSKGKGVETVRRVIQDSLDAVQRAYGFERPHLVVDWAPITAETETDVLIVREDRMIWDTIAEPCKLFGIGVNVTPWWPGDAPFPTRAGVWDKPYAVGRVTVKLLGA